MENTNIVSTVKRLKHYFDNLNTDFRNHKDLNKSSPKNNYYTGESTKGVESDFIRIYRAGKIGKEEFSFAFSINQPEDSTKSLITVNYKLGEDVVSGRTYNFEDFKEKLKEFIKVISILKDIKSNSPESIKLSIYKVFEFEKQKSSDEELLFECKSKIEKETTIIQSNYESNLNKIKTVEKGLLSSNREYDTFKVKRRKELGIDILEKQLKELMKGLNKELTEKTVELKIKEKTNELNTLNMDKRTIAVNKSNQIKLIIKEYPIHIQKIISKQLGWKI